MRAEPVALPQRDIDRARRAAVRGGSATESASTDASPAAPDAAVLVVEDEASIRACCRRRCAESTRSTPADGAPRSAARLGNTICDCGHQDAGLDGISLTGKEAVKTICRCSSLVFGPSRARRSVQPRRAAISPSHSASAGLAAAARAGRVSARELSFRYS